MNKNNNFEEPRSIRVVIYGLLVTPKKEQIRFIKSLAKRANLEVVGIFLEESYGPQYPAFIKMMDRMKGGDVESIVIFSLYELPKVSEIKKEFADILETYGIRLMLIVENEDGSDISIVRFGKYIPISSKDDWAKWKMKI